MKRPVFLLILLAGLGCDRPPPAEQSSSAVPDSAAATAADTLKPDSVMARDTARQLPER